MAVFKDFSSTMRNHKEIRHLIVPASYLTSALRLAADQSSARLYMPIGLDAAIEPSFHPEKPSLVVVVVGETVRAANWGLSGYARQTTPQLSALGVVNFPYATTCGTNTEVSVPCMFSARGKRNYDEKIIRSSESLLHVVARAGVAVTWIDNQSGCKGVCKNIPTIQANELSKSALCMGGECLDEVLVPRLMQEASTSKGHQLLVLHEMGNHGPAYFARYPKKYEQFKPACMTSDLSQCTQNEIVNAYDNAIVYTDQVLTQMIAALKTIKDKNVALIYVSDHGESLGENGFYLHGLPYAIAPDEQTRVPFMAWFSDGFYESEKLRLPCLTEVAKTPAHHDNLFHTVLGMLHVTTREYESQLDLLKSCRS